MQKDPKRSNLYPHLIHVEIRNTRRIVLSQYRGRVFFFSDLLPCHIVQAARYYETDFK